MNRRLAGAFDPHGRLGPVRLGDQAADLGPLRVAFDGSAPPSARPLCLLDGWLDNRAELAAELGVPDEAGAEQALAIAWRRWGPGLLERLRGDFVLLLWDTDRNEGLLARDQLGARSLYLHGGPDGMRFAGEIRDLLALLPRRPEPDRESVAHWLALSERPGTATLFAGIRRLAPGMALLLGRDGVREETYWAPRFEEPLAGEARELASEVRSALDAAVGRRLDAEAPTGVLMSGGLDSASVVALAANQAPGRVYACSGLFPGHPLVDESELVAQLRAALALPGVDAEVAPGGLVASAASAIQAWQVPPVGWGEFWVLPLLRRAAEANVRTVLGGDGGDELFGARSYLLADRLRAGHPVQMLRLARELPGAGYGPPRREMASMVAGVGLLGALPYGPDRRMRGHLLVRRAPHWLRAQTRRDLSRSSDPLAWKRLDGPRWWANAAYGLTQGIEQNGVFEQQRRTAAAAGLQARHPLLDLDLVTLGLRLPALASYDRYLNRPVLRAAMAGLLPDAIRLRPQKVVFDSLLVDCLAGPDEAAVRSLLADPNAELCAYLDGRAMRRQLLDSDRLRLERPFRWMWQVWRLCTAELWLRQQAGSALWRDEKARPSPARVTLRSTPVDAQASTPNMPPPTPPPTAPSPSTVSYVFPP